MARILLIDDDDGFRLMLKTALEKADYHVVEASNGKEGYDLFKEQPCDLIITDIFMPEKEGIHTIFDFKTEYPDTKIIAISGGAVNARTIDKDDVLQLINKNLDRTEILELATDFGADEVMSKPISIREFLHLVKNALSDSPLDEPDSA